MNKEEFIKTFQHDECSFLKTGFGDKHKENKDDDKAPKTHRLSVALAKPCICLSSAVNQYLIGDHSE